LALLEDRATEAMNGASQTGALVFLAVPDEEGSSHGMLSAVRELPEILRVWGIEALAAINLDAAVDQGDGAAGRAVFLGSVGKLHPFALFVGRPTHAGAPFDGINPVLAAAGFARGMECSTDIFDQSNEGFVEAEAGVQPPPPPTILYYREIRDHYDVTTPSAVFISVNVLTQRDGPEEILRAVSGLAASSMKSADELLRIRAESFSLATGQRFSPPDRALRVVSWAELKRSALQADPVAYKTSEVKARGSADRIAALASFITETASIAGLEGPVAVVGLAPPYYPRAALDTEGDAWLIAAVEAAVVSMNQGKEAGVTIRRFFPGISDMSYLNPCDSPEARNLADEACPFGLDPLPAGFSCPVVNIGPWGREYHQRLERVHAGYAFEVLPGLLERTVTEIFKSNVNA